MLVECGGVVGVYGEDRTVAAKAARRNAMGRCMVWITDFTFRVGAGVDVDVGR